MDTTERRKVSLMQALSTIRNEKVAIRKESGKRRRDVSGPSSDQWKIMVCTNGRRCAQLSVCASVLSFLAVEAVASPYSTLRAHVLSESPSGNDDRTAQVSKPQLRMQEVPVLV